MFRSHPSVGPRLLLLAAAAMLYSGGAVAALSDTIHPFVAIGYTYDDNLLRLPENYFGIAEKSDRSKQTQAGVIVDRPFGRQKLSGTAKVSRVTFDRFDQLNYNGKDFNGDLAWQLGNHLSGHLGGAYIETLTPFSDMVTDQRNIRTTRQVNGSAAWLFHPSWRLRGGVTQTKYDYELLVQRSNDRKERLTEFGGDYLARSGSTVGLVVRRWEGRYPTPRRVGNVVIANDFKQDELKANVRWIVSGITQVQVLAGYARREYDFFPTRDSSGFNGRASVRWAPLKKVAFTAEAWREFSAVESFIVSNSLNRGGSVGAVWDATAKVQVTANVKRQSRQFELLNTPAVEVDREDQTDSAQLAVSYAPTLSSQITMTLFREKREGSSLIGTNDYRAKGVSLNASVQF